MKTINNQKPVDFTQRRKDLNPREKHVVLGVPHTEAKVVTVNQEQTAPTNVSTEPTTPENTEQTDTTLVETGAGDELDQENANEVQDETLAEEPEALEPEPLEQEEQENLEETSSLDSDNSEIEDQGSF